MLLYEILTGQLPYAISEAAFHDAIRTIIEVSPTPISKIWPGERKVDRDLEVIALKALEKEPDRRYQSSLALAEDVDRYLTDQPILARPPSTIYQLRKMVKRHTVPSVLAAAMVVLIIGYSFVSVAQARRVARERDESEAVTEFLSDMLASADPTEERRDIQVQEVMVIAAEDLDSKFGDQLLIRARLHHTIGVVYNSLSQFPLAEEQLLKAIEIRKRELGGRDSRTFDSIYHLAVTYYWEGRYGEGMPLIRDAVSGYLSTLGEDDYYTLVSMNLLALYYLDQDRLEEAIPIAAEAVERWRGRQETGMVVEEGEQIEAEELLLNGYSGIENSTEAPEGPLRNMLEQIIRLYELWEKPDKVGEWRAKPPPGMN